MTTLAANGYPLRQIKSWIRRETSLSEGEKNFLEKSPYYLKNINEMMALSKSKAASGMPLFLDIGCGDGKSTLQLAKWAPQACVIGVEMHTPGIAKCLLQAHTEALENLFLFQGDIWDYLEAKQELVFDRIHLYFSDPWPKTKHHKRRLVQKDFFEALRKYISHNTVIHIATDWAHYAEHIAYVLKECEHFLTYSAQHENASMGPEFQRNLTKYEKRGLEKGHSIYEFYIQLKRENQL